MDMNQKNNEDQALEVAINDPTIRRSLTRESFLYFFCFYLHHYMKFPLAEFHKEIIRIAEDTSNHLCCLVAFRGSAKSTLITLAYCLWSILGKQEKKFVLIICQTQSQARLHMKNIRHELEANALLRSDLGPFQDEKVGEWAMPSIVFKNTGARITIASMDQSIRGMRHHEHRPDLIILDDIEDIASCKTKEGREKTFNWFTREVVPLGMGTRVIVVGNLLEDSLMMVKRIENNESDGIFKCYPLLDENGVVYGLESSRQN
jgi:predicted transcriptional regulator with HTH domain